MGFAARFCPIPLNKKIKFSCTSKKIMNAKLDTPKEDKEEEEEEEDQWNKIIKQTGCFEENERVLICHADTGDWRKCAEELKAFRDCISRNHHRSKSSD